MRLRQWFRGGLLAALVKLVVFVLVTVLATTVLANTIRGVSSRSGSDYSALFSDATMAAKGDEVRIAGVVVGAVTDVKLVRNAGSSQALVSFRMFDNRSLPTTTHATLRFRNLIGQRYLALSLEPGAVTGDLPKGATIGIAHTTPALDLTELFNGFAPLFTTLQPSDVNNLADSLIKVLQGEGGTVQSLIRQTGQLTSTLADRDAVIGDVITNLTQVLKTINDRDVRFQQLIVTTRELVEGLAQEKDSIGSAVDSLADLTAVTQNIVGATRPQIDASLKALDTVAADARSKNQVLDQVLTNLPIKTDKLIGIAQFGSWFQFYLCGIDINSGPGSMPGPTDPNAPTINTPIYTNSAPRCNGGGQ